MAEKIAFTTGKEDIGLRLDIVLSNHLQLTRSAAARLVTEGKVLVDERQRKPSFKIMAGMHLQVHIEDEGEPDTLRPYDIPLDILYEDPWIIAINKPAGLVVHPGAGNKDKTLVNALIAHYPGILGVGNEERPGIVHRLDKLTSGVMVIAKNEQAYHALIAAFKEHKHARVYQGLCYGHMKQSTGQIKTFMQRHPTDRKKMSSKVSEGREAVTNWEVIEEWSQFSLLKLSLETGRTHQIRVHLNDIGHPVVGDAQYGGKRQANNIIDPQIRSYVKSVDRQMLHAWMLGITHPETGEWMEFSCEIPDDMKRFIEILDEQRSRH